MVHFISSCGYKLLHSVLWFQPERFPSVFLIGQVCQWQIFSVFVFLGMRLWKRFSSIFLYQEYRLLVFKVTAGWRPGDGTGASKNVIRLTVLKEIWLFFLNKAFVNFQNSEKLILIDHYALKKKRKEKKISLNVEKKV